MSQNEHLPISNTLKTYSPEQYTKMKELTKQHATNSTQLNTRIVIWDFVFDYLH